MANYSMDEIYFDSGQSNQVVESRGTRLFRFRSLSGKYAQTSDGHGKNEKINFDLSRISMFTESHSESTENHLSSSGTSSQDTF